MRNAVLIGHGTGGSGAQFIRPEFAGELFGAGQPLDAGKYFIVLPDGIGHGKSAKPSDGLRAKFPQYGYTTWSKRNTACSPKGWASITCAWSWAPRWVACTPGCGASVIRISWTR